MRIATAALVLSVAVHGAALGWVATRKPTPPLAKPAPPPAPAPIAPPEVEPMVVALVDEPARPALPETAREVGAAPTRIAAATAAHRAESPGAPPPTQSPQRSSLMTMRQPELEGLSAGFLSNFLSKPVVPEPNPIAGERIEDDIAATEHDLHDPEWVAHASPDAVMAARAKLVALYDDRAGHELEPDGRGYKATHETYVAHVDPDGTAHLQDSANWQQHGATATFDVTDALMRAAGQDPYASAKLKLLDETRDERYEIGKRYKRDLLARSGPLALETLDWIWSTTRDVRERKQAVFELWDDCAESGSAELVEGGRAARRVIVGFIRSRLTGVDAFTPQELASLNAKKRSTATFAPYDE